MCVIVSFCSAVITPTAINEENIWKNQHCSLLLFLLYNRKLTLITFVNKTLNLHDFFELKELLATLSIKKHAALH